MIRGLPLHFEWNQRGGMDISSGVSPFILDGTNEGDGHVIRGFALDFEWNQRGGDAHVIRGFPLHFRWGETPGPSNPK